MSSHQPLSSRFSILLVTLAIVSQRSLVGNEAAQSCMAVITPLRAALDLDEPTP
jgi:hypothetical protein